MKLRYEVLDGKGDVVAAFRNIGDRELFMDVLRETFDDCEFTERESLS